MAGPRRVITHCLTACLTLTSMSGARTETQTPDPCTVGRWQGSWQAGPRCTRTRPGQLYKPGSGSHHDDIGPGNLEAKQQVILPPSSSAWSPGQERHKADSDLPGGSRQGGVPDILLVSRPRPRAPSWSLVSPSCPLIQGTQRSERTW